MTAWELWEDEGEMLFALHHVRAGRCQVNVCGGKQRLQASKTIAMSEVEEGPIPHLRIPDAISTPKV